MNIKNGQFRLALVALLSLLTLTLAACGGTSDSESDNSQAAPQAAAATVIPPGGVIELVDTFDDALAVKNQLLLGTLRLEGTSQAVSAQQQEELLLLWKAFASLTSSGIAAPEETEALQNQINAAMTPEQIGAIATLRLTNADLQDFYVETGLTEVKVPEPGVTPQGGQGQSMSQEEREATRVASGEEAGSGSGGSSGKSSALLDMVIELLESE